MPPATSLHVLRGSQQFVPVQQTTSGGTGTARLHVPLLRLIQLIPHFIVCSLLAIQRKLPQRVKLISISLAFWHIAWLWLLYSHGDQDQQSRARLATPLITDLIPPTIPYHVLYTTGERSKLTNRTGSLPSQATGRPNCNMPQKRCRLVWQRPLAQWYSDQPCCWDCHETQAFHRSASVRSSCHWMSMSSCFCWMRRY